MKKASIVLSDLPCETILTDALTKPYILHVPNLNRIFLVGKNILTRDVDSIGN